MSDNLETPLITPTPTTHPLHDFIRRHFPETEYDEKLFKLIKEKNGRPSCFQGGHPAIGAIIYALLMAGVLPGSVYHSVKEHGAVGIPQGLLNGVATITTGAFYLPTVTTSVVCVIPVGVANILTFGRFDLTSRYRYGIFKMMYSYEELLKNLYTGSLMEKVKEE